MRILSRYVLGSFLRPLAFSVTAFLVIFIVVDLANRMSAFLDRETPVAAIAAYYAWSVPYFAFLTLPMAMLLASLFCIGGLARRNELAAMKAAGVSVYRILLPIAVFALCVSAGAWGASQRLVPAANRHRAQIEAGAPMTRDILRAQIVLRDVEGQVLSLGEYRADEMRGRRVTLDRYSDGELSRKVRSKEMLRRGDRWVFVDGEDRRFRSGRERVAVFDSLEVEALTLTPDDLARESRPVEQMDTSALAGLIDRKILNGADATREVVEYHLRSAFSFASFVIVLFGLPLSSRTRHAARPLQVGICLLVSFVFYGSLQAGRAMGWNGLLPPIPAAWGANVLFLAVGGLMLARAHK